MSEIITVYSVEVMRRLRSRAFIVGLLLGVVGMLAFVKLPSLMASASLTGAKKIVLAGNPALVASAKTLLRSDYTIVGTSPAIADPAADLQRYHASGIVEMHRRADGLHVTAYVHDPGDISADDLRTDLLPLRVQTAMRLPQGRVTSIIHTPIVVKTVSGKFQSAQQSNSARVLAYIMLFVLYLLTMINSQFVMSSVAEEKTSRIAELLVAAVRPSSLLAGKIAASATLAFIQLAVWIATALIFGANPAAGPSAAAASSQNPMTFSAGDVSGLVLGGFFIFFLLALVETTTLFAALGSLVNRTEDLGSVTGPLMMPIIAAFFIAIFGLAVPESPLILVTSFIPIISPFVMFTRIAVSTVPMWQIALAIAINLLAIWGIAVAGGKIYRVGMLLYGRPPKFSQIWAVLRT